MSRIKEVLIKAEDLGVKTAGRAIESVLADVLALEANPPKVCLVRIRDLKAGDRFLINDFTLSAPDARLIREVESLEMDAKRIKFTDGTEIVHLGNVLCAVLVDGAFATLARRIALEDLIA